MYSQQIIQAIDREVFVIGQVFLAHVKAKGKAIPVQAWKGPDGSRG
jgi:hypothetical protein